MYTHEGLISFTIDSISAGEHTLEVSYEANISEWYNENELSVTRAFVYILKPYQGWKEFKNLNLNVFIPTGWDYSSNMEMERHASHAVHGFWNEIPSDYLELTLKPKEGPARILSILFVLISASVATLLIITWMKKIIEFRLRRNNSKLIKIGNNILVSFIATVFFYLIYFYEPELKNQLLDNHLNPYYTYGIGYFVLAFPVLWMAGLIVSFIIDYFLTIRIKNKLVTKLYKKEQ